VAVTACLPPPSLVLPYPEVFKVPTKDTQFFYKNFL
jgi:hypothetical protein